MTYHEGKLYTGSLDGKVMQWDAKSGEKMHTFELPALPPTGC
jgi:sugar lactone lactonase YvrE